MSTIRTIANIPTRPFRLAAIGIMLMLLLATAAQPAVAQTPVPAAPDNLKAELTDINGEILLSWDTAEGATAYRVCGRVQKPLGGWGCQNRTTTSILFKGLTMDAAYDYAVASYDGRAYSSWVWTEATVAVVEPEICPITGLPIGDGYKDLGEASTSDVQSFTLNTATFPASTTLLRDEIMVPGQARTKYLPPVGRRWAKTCGAHTNHSAKNRWFGAGYHQNLATDKGIAFVTDEQATFLGDIYRTKPSETRTVCQLWHIPDDAETLIVAVGLDVTSSDSYHLYKIDVPAN